MSDNTLDGSGVLVTRPRQQAGELIAAIERRGGIAIAFPAIEIVPRDPALVKTAVRALATPDITVFVSSNAVEHGLTYAGGELAAIGPATAAAIRDAGSEVDICPQEGFDSEHLLREPGFADVDGKTVRIIRGNAGREHFANALRKRGARVNYLATYDRRQPQYAATDLDALEKRWRNSEVQAVIAMSVQSLQNLAALLPDWCREQLRFTPLVTPAVRVLKEAQSAFPGCAVTLAAGPGNDDIVDAVVKATQQSAIAPPVSG